MNFKKVIGASFVGATLLGTVAPVAASAATATVSLKTMALPAGIQSYVTAGVADEAADAVDVANFLQTTDSVNQAQTAVSNLSSGTLQNYLNKQIYAIKMNMAATIQAMQLKQLNTLVAAAVTDPHPANVQAALAYANGPLAKPVNQNIQAAKNGLLYLLATESAFPVAGISADTALTGWSQVPKATAIADPNYQTSTDDNGNVTYYVPTTSFTESQAAWNSVYLGQGNHSVYSNPSAVGTAANFTLAQQVIAAMAGDHTVIPLSSGSNAVLGGDTVGNDFGLNRITNNGNYTVTFEGEWGTLTTGSSNANLANSSWLQLAQGYKPGTNIQITANNRDLGNTSTGLLNTLIKASGEFNVQYLNGNFTSN